MWCDKVSEQYYFNLVNTDLKMMKDFTLPLRPKNIEGRYKKKFSPNNINDNELNENDRTENYPLTPSLSPTAPPPTNPASTTLLKDELDKPTASSVYRFAREIDINIEQISGSGKARHIFNENVKAYAEHLLEQTQVSPPTQETNQHPLPDF